jgi:hypothetical protein
MTSYSYQQPEEECNFKCILEQDDMNQEKN